MNNLTTTGGNQLSTLSDKISAVNDLLTPASDNSIASAVIKLAGIGLPFPPGLDPEKAALVYQFALRGVAHEAIKRVVLKITQGEVPSVMKFLPAPPELAALCKAEAREIWTDRERLIALKEAMEFKRPGGLRTEEEKARVRAMVDQVKRNAAALRDEVKDEFYNKPEDELNRIFRNKVDPPAEPSAGKFNDEEWFSQHKENENGEKTERNEDPIGDHAVGGSDGPQDDIGSVIGVFGFEGES